MHAALPLISICLTLQEAPQVKVEAAENSVPEPKQAPVAEPQLQEPTEEEREQREAEFEEQLRMRVVRSDLIGRDRHFRRYWWLQGRIPDLSSKPHL